LRIEPLGLMERLATENSALPELRTVRVPTGARISPGKC
jgi:hypothetical protein